MASGDFRRLLEELEDNIVEEDVEKLKVFLKGRKGYGMKFLEKSKTARTLFERMEKNNDLSIENTSYLSDLLKDVHRKDLCAKVEEFERSHGLQPYTGIRPSSKRRRERSTDSSHGASAMQRQKPGTSSVEAQANYPEWFTECNNPVGIRVTKCTKKENPFGGDVPVYDTRNKVGIRVLIINNKIFTARRRGVQTIRHGTDMDRNRLQKIFTDLGFTDVNIEENQTGQGILDIMDTEAQIASDGFICVILSHGDLGILYGTDWRPVSIPNIYSKFLGDQCPQLVDKPKIFLIQACLGRQQDRGAQAIDSGSGTGAVQFPWTNILPTGSDLLVAFSTMPGFVSIRDEYDGSWYISALVYVLMKNAHKDHLLDMLTEVNRLVSQLATLGDQDIIQGGKQGCMCLTSLRKRLYFVPGL